MSKSEWKHQVAFVALCLLLIAAVVFLLGISTPWPYMSSLPKILLISPPILTWLVALLLLVAGPGVIVRVFAALSVFILLVLIAGFLATHRPGERDGLIYILAECPLAVVIGYLCALLASVVATACPVGYGPGRCSECGYNLTGNTSGTCPECGTAVPPLPSAPPRDGVH